MKARISPVVATTRKLREMVSREHGHDVDRLIDHLVEQHKTTRNDRKHGVDRARKRSSTKRRAV